jgi:hypothetical protein
MASLSWVSTPRTRSLHCAVRTQPPRLRRRSIPVSTSADCACATPSRATIRRGGRCTAFDDGRKIYIEFPRGIAQGEMPPLFIIGPDGKTSELVNYRVRNNHMIVDRLFAAAELRLADKGTERRVRVVRNDGGLT